MMEKRTQVRMPVKIHSWLSDRANRNNRSLNGEMITIFQTEQAKEEADKQVKEDEQPENQ